MESKTRVDFDDENAIPAEEYEQLARKFIPGYDGLYALLHVLLAENLPERAEILIVGAGGGKEIVTLGKAFPAARMTGVDPSEKMLAVAQKLLQKDGLESRTNLLQGTVFDVEEKQFDAATSILVMHFLPDDGEKLEFLQAIHRRLKPNAKFIIADGCFDKTSPDFKWLLDSYKNHAETNGAPSEITSQAVETVTEKVHGLSAERNVELLREAGFVSIRSFFQGLWVKAWIAAKS
jgi:tRNA (cmo5U34)-methyltransferase